MQLVRFDPFSTMREFDRLFEGNPANRWMPRVDVFDRDNELMVRTEVPGVDPENIEITVEGGTLTIKGDRSFSIEDTQPNYHRKEIFEGAFEGTVLLPEGIDRGRLCNQQGWHPRGERPQATRGSPPQGRSRDQR